MRALAGGLCRRIIRRHRNNEVLALLVIEVLDPQQNPVFVETELCLFTDGQQHWMFVVLRANGVQNAVRLENVLLAQQIFGLHVRRVGADQLSGKALAVLFVQPALHRFHLQQLAALVMPGFLGLGRSRNQHNGQNILQSHRRESPVRGAYRRSLLSYSERMAEALEDSVGTVTRVIGNSRYIRCEVRNPRCSAILQGETRWNLLWPHRPRLPLLNTTPSFLAIPVAWQRCSSLKCGSATASTALAPCSCST